MSDLRKTYKIFCRVMGSFAGHHHEALMRSPRTLIGAGAFFFLGHLQRS